MRGAHGRGPPGVERGEGWEPPLPAHRQGQAEAMPGESLPHPGLAPPPPAPPATSLPSQRSDSARSDTGALAEPSRPPSHLLSPYRPGSKDPALVHQGLATRRPLDGPGRSLSVSASEMPGDGHSGPSLNSSSGHGSSGSSGSSSRMTGQHARRSLGSELEFEGLGQIREAPGHQHPTLAAASLDGPGGTYLLSAGADAPGTPSSHPTPPVSGGAAGYRDSPDLETPLREPEGGVYTPERPLGEGSESWERPEEEGLPGTPGEHRRSSSAPRGLRSRALSVSESWGAGVRLLGERLSPGPPGAPCLRTPSPVGGASPAAAAAAAARRSRSVGRESHSRSEQRQAGMEAQAGTQRQAGAEAQANAGRQAGALRLAGAEAQANAGRQAGGKDGGPGLGGRAKETKVGDRFWGGRLVWDTPGMRQEAGASGGAREAHRQAGAGVTAVRGGVGRGGEASAQAGAGAKGRTASVGGGRGRSVSPLLPRWASFKPTPAPRSLVPPHNPTTLFAATGTPPQAPGNAPHQAGYGPGSTDAAYGPGTSQAAYATHGPGSAQAQAAYVPLNAQASYVSVNAQAAYGPGSAQAQAAYGAASIPGALGNARADVSGEGDPGSAWAQMRRSRSMTEGEGEERVGGGGRKRAGKGGPRGGGGRKGARRGEGEGEGEAGEGAEHCGDSPRTALHQLSPSFLARLFAGSAPWGSFQERSLWGGSAKPDTSSPQASARPPHGVPKKGYGNGNGNGNGISRKRNLDSHGKPHGGGAGHTAARSTSTRAQGSNRASDNIPKSHSASHSTAILTPSRSGGSRQSAHAPAAAHSSRAGGTPAHSQSSRAGGAGAGSGTPGRSHSVTSEWEDLRIQSLTKARSLRLQSHDNDDSEGWAASAQGPLAHSRHTLTLGDPLPARPGRGGGTRAQGGPSPSGQGRGLFGVGSGGKHLRSGSVDWAQAWRGLVGADLTTPQPPAHVRSHTIGGTGGRKGRREGGGERGRESGVQHSRSGDHFGGEGDRSRERAVVRAGSEKERSAARGLDTDPGTPGAAAGRAAAWADEGPSASLVEDVDCSLDYTSGMPEFNLPKSVSHGAGSGGKALAGQQQTLAVAGGQQILAVTGAQQTLALERATQRSSVLSRNATVASERSVAGRHEGTPRGGKDRKGPLENKYVKRRTRSEVGVPHAATLDARGHSTTLARERSDRREAPTHPGKGPRREGAGAVGLASAGSGTRAVKQGPTGMRTPSQRHTSSFHASGTAPSHRHTPSSPAAGAAPSHRHTYSIDSVKALFTLQGLTRSFSVRPQARADRADRDLPQGRSKSALASALPGPGQGTPSQGSGGGEGAPGVHRGGEGQQGDGPLSRHKRAASLESLGTGGVHGSGARLATGADLEETGEELEGTGQGPCHACGRHSPRETPRGFAASSDQSPHALETGDAAAQIPAGSASPHTPVASQGPSPHTAVAPRGPSPEPRQVRAGTKSAGRQRNHHQGDPGSPEGRTEDPSVGEGRGEDALRPLPLFQDRQRWLPGVPVGAGQSLRAGRALGKAQSWQERPRDRQGQWEEAAAGEQVQGYLHRVEAQEGAQGVPVPWPVQQSPSPAALPLKAAPPPSVSLSPISPPSVSPPSVSPPSVSLPSVPLPSAPPPSTALPHGSQQPTSQQAASERVCVPPPAHPSLPSPRYRSPAMRHRILKSASVGSLERGPGVSGGTMEQEKGPGGELTAGAPPGGQVEGAAVAARFGRNPSPPPAAGPCVAAAAGGGAVAPPGRLAQGLLDPFAEGSAAAPGEGGSPACAALGSILEGCEGEGAGEGAARPRRSASVPRLRYGGYASGEVEAKAEADAFNGPAGVAASSEEVAGTGNLLGAGTAVPEASVSCVIGGQKMRVGDRASGVTSDSGVSSASGVPPTSGEAFACGVPSASKEVWPVESCREGAGMSEEDEQGCEEATFNKRAMEGMEEVGSAGETCAGQGTATSGAVPPHLHVPGPTFPVPPPDVPGPRSRMLFPRDISLNEGMAEGAGSAPESDGEEEASGGSPPGGVQAPQGEQLPSGGGEQARSVSSSGSWSDGEGERREDQGHTGAQAQEPPGAAGSAGTPEAMPVYSPAVEPPVAAGPSGGSSESPRSPRLVKGRCLTRFREPVREHRLPPRHPGTQARAQAMAGEGAEAGAGVGTNAVSLVGAELGALALVLTLPLASVPGGVDLDSGFVNVTGQTAWNS